MIHFNAKDRRLIAANGGLPLLPRSGPHFPVLQTEFEDTPADRQVEWLTKAAAFEHRAANDIDKRREACIAHLIAAMRSHQEQGQPIEPLFDIYMALVELQLGRRPTLFTPKALGKGGSQPKIIACLGWAHLVSALEAKYILSGDNSKEQRAALLIDLREAGLSEDELSRIFALRERKKQKDDGSKPLQTMENIRKEFSERKFHRGGDVTNFAQHAYDCLRDVRSRANTVELRVCYHRWIAEAVRLFRQNGLRSD